MVLRRDALWGAMEIKLPKGQLRITGSVEAEALRIVLECLLG